MVRFSHLPHLFSLAAILLSPLTALAQVNAFADYRNYGQYQGADCRKSGNSSFVKEDWWFCPDSKKTLWMISPSKKMALWFRFKSCSEPVLVAFAGSNSNENDRYLRGYGLAPFENKSWETYYRFLAKDQSEYLQAVNKCSSINGKYTFTEFSKEHTLVYPSPWNKVGKPSGCEYAHQSLKLNHANNCQPVLDN